MYTRGLLPPFALVLLILVSATFSLAANSTDPLQFIPVQNGPATDAPTVLPYAPDRLLVKLTEDAMERMELWPSSDRGVITFGADTGLPSLDAIASRAAVRSIERPYDLPNNERSVIELGIDRWFLFRFDGRDDIPELAELFAADPNVEAVSLDWVGFPDVVPSDPYHSHHWGHNNTGQLPSYDWSVHAHTGPPVGTVGFDSNAEAAWDAPQGYGSSGVIIAIIDSGVDIDHADLRLVAGYDYGDNDSNPDDNSPGAGHGTCCAGVAAAIVNNGIEVDGIAGGCSVMPLKVASSTGTIYFSAAINAIYHAADNGADVVSMSFGANISGDPATDTAIQYAYNAGCVLLAATGNNNESHISYPANNAHVIGVGAASPCGDRKRSSSSPFQCNPGVSPDPNGYTCDGERWWGSSYGVNAPDAAGAVDVIAPTILPTTDIEGYAGYNSGDVEEFFNGTSCATPYAAGVCALIKSANPTWTNVQIRGRLCDTAIDIVNVESGSGWDRYSGYGMVDARAAVGASGPVAPTAAFVGSPLSGFFPLAVDFTDLSSGAPTSWSWTFGDGGTSSARHPSHTYTAAGAYTVTLTVSNAAGSDDEVKIDYITVTDPAEAYATLPYGAGFESGALDQHWTTATTADGRIQISTDFAPHGGSYQLLMDDSVNGSSYSTCEAWLHLNLAGETDVELEFWWQDFSDETHAQDGVYFSDNSGNAFIKAHDIKGASTTSRMWQNIVLDVDALAAASGLSLTSTFVVKFQQYDNYSITSDGLGFDDINVTGVSGAPPVAGFSGTPTSGTEPLTVSFTDASTGNATSWNWSFGDGGTSTEQNPTHEYTSAGTYTVSLTATNAHGSADEIKTDYITVDPCNPPAAAFTGTPTSGRAPLSVSFTDESSDSPTSWNWSFGDGGTSTAQNPDHTYSAAGTYTVTLTATSACGSDDEIKTDYITVTEPAGWTVITYDDFESGWGSYAEGGGDCSRYTGAYAHQGFAAGNIQDDSGDASSFYHTDSHDVSGYAELEVEFWFYAHSMEANEDFWVQYYDGSTWQTVASYARGIEFENDVFYNKVAPIPAATYSYPVNAKLRFMCDASGNADDVYIDEIEFRGSGTAAPTPPTADFVGTPTSGVYPLDVTFSDISTGNPTIWSWDFGDGGTSTTRNPVHTYTAAGIYTVSLTATNAYGNDTETKTDYITVNDPGAGGWVTITYDDFESGWGSYADGGGDCSRYTGAYAHQGFAAGNIQDNSGVASSFYHTDSHDVSGCAELEVEFWFYAHSMESNEDFWVQYYDGSTWQTVASYARGIDFENDVFYNKVVQIPAGIYTYATNAKIRFRCDASGNDDDVYIDEVEFRGYSTRGSSQSERMADGESSTAAPVVLSQNRPNPFNPVTCIGFALTQETAVRLQVFDIRGRLVATLVERTLGAGDHSVVWDAHDASSGIYFYRIETPGFMETRKMTLLK